MIFFLRLVKSFFSLLKFRLRKNTKRFIFIFIFLSFCCIAYKLNSTVFKQSSKKHNYDIIKNIHFPFNSLSPGSDCSLRPIKVKDDDNIKLWMSPTSTTSNTNIVENFVLLFIEATYSKYSQTIQHALESWRLHIKVVNNGHSLPSLTHKNRARYSAIIFEKMQYYFGMDDWNRKLIDSYCRQYAVGMILLGNNAKNYSIDKYFKGLTTNVVRKLQDFKLVENAEILRTTRSGSVINLIPGEHWTVFNINDSYLPLATAFNYGESNTNKIFPAIIDNGKNDNIRRVFIGNNFFNFWLNRLLILDALCYVSHRQSLCTPLKRYIFIDIDDIFVGKTGNRLTIDDVNTLIQAQNNFANFFIQDFKFNLGYSGYWFQKHGSEAELDGDKYLVEIANNFNWFPHMWKHTQAHKLNATFLEADMLSNKHWATNHNIKVDATYSVAPHHSGVYPVHLPLYDTWKKIWNVQVTSTEQYPHLRPARFRRGFVYKTIKVLPRQTCGLFTHTVKMENYPNGPKYLLNSIAGGELFKTFIDNPISIFMTHMSNYGQDRLALFTFQSVLEWLNCWTNIHFQQINAESLATYYFNLFPDEVDPIWLDPCKDDRHLQINPEANVCGKFPQILIIGPQKTGTTALLYFLSQHKSIQVSRKSPDHYEETQFFSGNDYYKGLKFYRHYWTNNNNSIFKVDKSATYFTSEAAPRRSFALIPDAKIIVIASEPGKRAYSWYQHQRAHLDRTAEQYSFDEVLQANDNSIKPLRELKRHCLNPGHYSQHLERWLTFYPSSQLHVVDGDQLSTQPSIVLDTIQSFLDLEPYLNYDNILVKDKRKNFFCVRLVGYNRKKCLGKSKGRKYSPMTQTARVYLDNYFKKHNAALAKLLKRISIPMPSWLTNLSKENDDDSLLFDDNDIEIV